MARVECTTPSKKDICLVRHVQVFGLDERVRGMVKPIFPVNLTEEYWYQKRKRLSEIG